MNDLKLFVRDLRTKLPYGSFSKIKSRLNKKGKPFSVQYISRCLNPDLPDYNMLILEEAINVAKESTNQIKSTKKERPKGSFWKKQQKLSAIVEFLPYF